MPAISSVSAPMIAPTSAARRGPLEQRMQAADQVHAGGHHRRRVDQRGDRRRALHRVREPGVERDLGGLRERADQDQDHPGDEARVVLGERALHVGEQRAVVEHAHRAEDEERAEHEADVADDVDDERLDAGRCRGGAPVPVRDQHVARRADERPADDQQREVARQHEQQHREDEEVQVREEARVAAVGAHVADRVEVDQRRDAGDDERHEDRQRVDVDPELESDAGDVDEVPQRRRRDLRVLGAVLQLEERDDREDECERDRDRADPARDRASRRGRRRRSRTCRPAASRARARRRSSAHPCSSRSSSTSIGSCWRYSATIDAQADRDLTGGDDHHDDREDLAVAVGPHAREAEQREVAGVEHQLQAQQHDQRVAADQHADGADARTSAPRRPGTRRCSSPPSSLGAGSGVVTP